MVVDRRIMILYNEAKSAVGLSEWNKSGTIFSAVSSHAMIELVWRYSSDENENQNKRKAI